MVDVTTTLVRLAFMAAVLTIALEQIFETRLYQKYFGKGLDDKGSIFFKSFELRPWLSSGVGIFLALGFQMKALESGLGPDFISTSSSISENAEIVDMILTGLIIGGGTKTIKKLAKQFAAARNDIQGKTGL